MYDRLGIVQYFKGGNFQRQALVFGRVGEGQRTIVVGSRFSSQQRDIVDACNRFVDVAFAFPAEGQIPGF